MTKTRIALGRAWKEAAVAQFKLLYWHCHRRISEYHEQPLLEYLVSGRILKLGISWIRTGVTQLLVTILKFPRRLPTFRKNVVKILPAAHARREYSS
jgi:hypothetical protein